MIVPKWCECLSVRIFMVSKKTFNAFKTMFSVKHTKTSSPHYTVMDSLIFRKATSSVSLKLFLTVIGWSHIFDCFVCPIKKRVPFWARWFFFHSIHWILHVRSDLTSEIVLTFGLLVLNSIQNKSFHFIGYIALIAKISSLRQIPKNP